MWQVVAEPNNYVGHLKENCLPFEGWLEALVRLSILKALPTDEQIAAASCTTAPQWFRELGDGSSVRHFKKEHSKKQGWGSEPVVQPVARSLHHLVAVMFDKIEVDLNVKADGRLQKIEVDKWCKLSLGKA